MNLNKTREKNCGNFDLTLRGDGSMIPELIIRGSRGLTEGYVNADELRAMGKQLIKWADKLAAHGVSEADGPY